MVRSKNTGPSYSNNLGNTG
uniref:Uncharacterized protein n=1 Tax=Anguilla anguilla TaxID=7936 RepID=A0A0E9VQD6_ANGAN